MGEELLTLEGLKDVDAVVAVGDQAIVALLQACCATIAPKILQGSLCMRGG